MVISCEATVKFGTYSGRAEIAYSDTENQFTLRSAGSYGGRAVAGAMFGALGRAVYEGIASSKSLGSFPASAIRQVTVSETKKQIVYYLYGSDAQPYEFTLGKKEKLNDVILQLYGDRISAVAPKQSAAAAPQVPTPPPAPPVQPPVPPAPPVTPPVQPPVQQPSATIAHPAPAVPMTVKPEATNALLCLRTGPLAGRNFQCPPGCTVIVGRDPSRCNLGLPQYINVSGVHCRMDIGDHFVTVTDLGSTNGTYVRGQRLAPNQSVMVPIGETVMLANEICVFQIFFE